MIDLSTISQCYVNFLNVTLSVRAIFKNGFLLQYVTALILTRMHLRERLFAGVLLEGGGGVLIRTITVTSLSSTFPTGSPL